MEEFWTPPYHHALCPARRATSTRSRSLCHLPPAGTLSLLRARSFYFTLYWPIELLFSTSHDIDSTYSITFLSVISHTASEMSLVGNKWVAFAALAAGFVSSVGAQDHSLSGGSSGGSGGSSSSCSDTECFENEHYARYLIVSLCSVVVALTVYRLVLSGARYIRLLTCLGNDTQMYFQKPVAWFGKMKQHLLYAPLFRTRHMEEIHLARWWSIGILPTRFQSLFLTGIIALNVALCFNGIQWSQAGTKEGQAMVLAHFRNRSGILSIVNMIPLVIMAGRNNPLIVLLNLPYDTFNLMHRWFGRIVVVEAVAHTVAWTINKVQTCKLP